MHSIKHLRQAVIDELGLDPETVATFVKMGKVRSHFERENDTPNRHFRTEYEGVLIILDYIHPAEHIFWVVANWLHRHHPSISPTAIGFDAEIINSDSVDLKISIAGLAETYKPSVGEDGVTIINCTNFPADPVIRAEGLDKAGLGLDGLIVTKCDIGKRKNEP